MTKQNWSAKPGEMFRLGEHRLLCGDARDPEAARRLVAKDRIDLILTDPPYGVAYVEGKADFGAKLAAPKAIVGDHVQSEAEYRDLSRRWMAAAKPFLARQNAFYAFNSDKMLFAMREGLQEAGARLTQLLVWVKTHAVLGRMDYLLQHEYVAYGWVGTHAFRKAKDKSVLVYPKPNRSPLHPTMKPVGLLRRLILNSTKIGGIVYDPFGGSGSTLIACEDARRKCLMIELDPIYCTTIVARWEKQTGKKAQRIT